MKPRVLARLAITLLSAMVLAAGCSSTTTSSPAATSTISCRLPRTTEATLSTIAPATAAAATVDAVRAMGPLSVMDGASVPHRHSVGAVAEREPVADHADRVLRVAENVVYSVAGVLLAGGSEEHTSELSH